jgi:bis(5'-nucleosyl)-tetraphosphatase (symmetrical)
MSVAIRAFAGSIFRALPRLLCTCSLAARRTPPFPSPSKHVTLASNRQVSRTIIIGDVHGCLDELQDLLATCQYDRTNTRVVLVGDLVNKGPKSAECVQFVRTQGFSCVRGNHDDAALWAWERRETERRDGGTAIGDGKYAYTDQFSAEDVAFLRGLPHTILIPDEELLVVHAGLVPRVPLEEQEPACMYKMRNLIEREGTASGTEEEGKDGVWNVGAYTATAAAKRGTAWAAEWRPDAETLPGVSHIVFGHDAKRRLQQHAHATGLDTGACYGGELSALVLPGRHIVSVPARRVYTKPAGS